MIGIPCLHAFFAILFNYGDSEDYVDDYYSIERYKKAYAPITYLLPSKEQLIRTKHDKLKLPRAIVALGRPKKQRNRNLDESKDQKN